MNARCGDFKTRRNYYDFCITSHRIFTKCQALNLTVLKTHIMSVIHLPAQSVWTVSVLLSLLFLFLREYQGINPHTSFYLPHSSWRHEYYVAILFHSRSWWWFWFLNVHYLQFSDFFPFQSQQNYWCPGAWKTNNKSKKKKQFLTYYIYF